MMETISLYLLVVPLALFVIALIAKPAGKNLSMNFAVGMIGLSIFAFSGLADSVVFAAIGLALGIFGLAAGNGRIYVEKT